MSLPSSNKGEEWSEMRRAVLPCTQADAARPAFLLNTYHWFKWEKPRSVPRLDVLLCVAHAQARR